MRLYRVIRRTRRTSLLAGVAVSLGILTACSAGTTEPAGPTNAVAMPQTATYIADMPGTSGTTMTMAITVEGDKVIAYATNGTNDEAYFVGTQTAGQMDLASMYGDNLTASFDGSKVNGEITMNDGESAPVSFAASSVAAPAGLYTATQGNARASFVVRPDRTMVGVMNNSAPGDHKVTDAIAAQDQAFKDGVRQMRLDQQMQQAPQMTYGTWSMTMNGTKVTAVRVTGGMTI